MDMIQVLFTTSTESRQKIHVGHFFDHHITSFISGKTNSNIAVLPVVILASNIIINIIFFCFVIRTIGNDEYIMGKCESNGGDCWTSRSRNGDEGEDTSRIVIDIERN